MHGLICWLLKTVTHFLFVQDLHGEELVRPFMFDEHHSAK